MYRRLVDASPFSLFLDTSLFEIILIHSCTMLISLQLSTVLAYCTNKAWGFYIIRDDVKLAQLVRAWDCLSRGRRFGSGKNSKKIENSNLHGLEMMTIAFVTFKSSLVPLFEGL